MRVTEHRLTIADAKAALSAHRTAVTLLREGHDHHSAAVVLTQRFAMDSEAATYFVRDVWDRGLHRTEDRLPEDWR